MKKTKLESLLAGSTAVVPAGATSLPVMKHGDEPPAMLLAILNSALETMTANSQAKIIGRGMFRNGRPGTVVIIYDVQPTANGSKLVGCAVGNVEAIK